MNIHPLFVHFPIGLLVVYALLELASLHPRVRGASAVWSIKAFLSVIGALFAYVTAFFGEMAEQALNPSGNLSKLIDTHSAFAYATVFTFSFLAGAYAVAAANRSGFALRPFFSRSGIRQTWSFLSGVSRFILLPQIAAVLAIGGLAFIIITGGLGASIVYGPNFDPFVHFIYGMFFRG